MFYDITIKSKYLGDEIGTYQATGFYTKKKNTIFLIIANEI